MKAVVAAFNQEKALVGAFSVITNIRMDLFRALVMTLCDGCVQVTVAEVQRRLSPPECLNASLLGGVLRR